MFSSILVPLDGSSLSQRALPYAAAIARAAHSRLVLVRAAMAHTFPGADATAAQVRAVEEAEASLDALVAPLRAQGLACEAHVYYDDPLPAIEDAVGRQQADLIVMSTHGRGGLGRWIYGSVADGVLRQATVPVLVVPPHADLPWPPPAADQANGWPPRVILGLDGSALAETAASPAAALARALGASLLLLSVVEPPSRLFHSAESYAALDFRPAGAIAEAQRRLERIARQVARETGLAVETLALTGHPGAAIAAVAHEQGAAAIALATHGRGGALRLVLGSVAADTLQRATVPVLLVRPRAIRPQPAEALPPAAEPAAPPASEPVTMTLSTPERDPLRQGLELLLTSARRDEHLALPIQQLLSKLREAGSASRAEATR